MGNAPNKGRSSPPFVYEIDEAHGLVRVTGEGPVTLTDTIHHIEFMHSHPMYRQGMDNLIDLTNATMKGDYQIARQLYLFVRSVRHAYGHCRWAFVVPRDVSYGLVRMFASMSESLPIRIEPFRTIEEAEVWLSKCPEV